MDGDVDLVAVVGAVKGELVFDVENTCHDACRVLAEFKNGGVQDTGRWWS